MVRKGRQIVSLLIEVASGADEERGQKTVGLKRPSAPFDKEGKESISTGDKAEGC